MKMIKMEVTLNTVCKCNCIKELHSITDKFCWSCGKCELFEPKLR